MIYKNTILTTEFKGGTSPKLLCIGSSCHIYEEGQVWQVIDGVLCRISPKGWSTHFSGFSGVWQELEEKSLEEQVKELLG